MDHLSALQDVQLQKMCLQWALHLNSNTCCIFTIPAVQQPRDSWEKVSCNLSICAPTLPLLPPANSNEMLTELAFEKEKEEEPASFFFHPLARALALAALAVGGHNRPTIIQIVAPPEWGAFIRGGAPASIQFGKCFMARKRA